MAVLHDLHSNGYLVNNEIWMRLTSTTTIKYFTVTVKNFFLQSSGKFIFYPDKNKQANFNLQPLVKSLIPQPVGELSNSDLQFMPMQIIVGTDTELTSFFLDKYFIRGGNRTAKVNQTQSPNTNLRISERLPVWTGYPTEDQYTENYIVKFRSVSSAEKVDYRRIRSGNNCYIKFLNQKGGYSFWLFESFAEKESANPLGFNAPTQGGLLLNLGSDVKHELKIYSKIPAEYVNYVKDLVVTPAVYVYDKATAMYKTAFMKSNNIEFDDVKKVYSVTLTLDLYYRFNPSLLWSN